MADTWVRLRELFEGALALPEAERQAFLREACAEQPELYGVVRRLLEMDASESSLLDRPLVSRQDPPTDVLPTTLAPFPTMPPRDSRSDLPEDRIGPYRLLRRIGQGGIGVVFLAVRDDDTFERRVAIKWVREDLDTPDLRRRLKAERRILASLEHPYIARVHDGGVTAAGRPYVVMEYIEGVPVDTFCDQNRLTIFERLILFRKICEAVQYAHQNLVIHRDLKPSNILVAADGNPRLLDFGLAKLLQPEWAGKDLEPTRTAMRMMTPSFASPEQIRGALVTTASDIYSLGVLLFRLLTGKAPFALEGKSPAEVERLLHESDPPRPSTVVDPAARTSSPRAAEVAAGGEAAWARRVRPPELRRLLRGDLDAIVLRALRVEPHRRYASADRFAEDIRRFAEGLPVLARQGSRAYTLGKFLRRHRVAVAVSALVWSILITGSILLAAQNRRIADARDRAQAAQARSQKVLTVVLDTFRQTDPFVGGGEDWTVRRALGLGRPRLRHLLRDDPALLAQALHVIGEIEANLGLSATAVVDLQEAVDLWRSIYGPEDPQVALSQAVLALAWLHAGEHEKAAERAREALALVQGRSDVAPEVLARVLNLHVTVLCGVGEVETAAPWSSQALALARGLPADQVEVLADALTNHGTVLLHSGDARQAAELYVRALELLEDFWGESSLPLVGVLNNLAASLRRSGDLEAARESFERALEILKSHATDPHPQLPVVLNNLAQLSAQLGETQQALDFYGQAREALIAAQGEEHPRVSFLTQQILRLREVNREGVE